MGSGATKLWCKKKNIWTFSENRGDSREVKNERETKGEGESQQDSPAEAEEGQVKAQQSGHDVSDEGTGLSGVEVDPKPHGHQQGEQLTRHEVDLHRRAAIRGQQLHSATD